MQLNFTNRETYLAWRAEWKAAYKTLSTDIRAAKLAIKDGFRSGDLDSAARAQRTAARKSALATAMLETLKEAKAKSAEQKAAAFAAAA